MNKQEFKTKTKCPFCKIGFMIVCTNDSKFEHLDIIWTGESGLVLECGDHEAIREYIVPNTKWGTGYSLSEEMENIFKELNNDFHTNPSEFSKENTNENQFYTLLGEFFRYSDYMNDREPKEDANEIAQKLYEEGKNLMEIMEEATISNN